MTLHTLECVLGIIPPFSTERAVLHGSADYDGRVWVTSETEDPSLANNEATVHVADERSPATGACSAAPGRRGGSALWIVAVACAGAGAARRRRRAA